MLRGCGVVGREERGSGCDRQFVSDDEPALTKCRFFQFFSAHRVLCGGIVLCY